MGFLGMMCPLRMAKIEGIKILDYVGGVAKAKIAPVNTDKQ